MEAEHAGNRLISPIVDIMGILPPSGADPMGNCKGKCRRPCWQCSSRVDETFAGVGSGGPAWPDGMWSNKPLSDTSETTVLSEKMGQGAVTLAPIQNHLGQKWSECSQELLLRPAHHAYVGRPPTWLRTQHRLFGGEVLGHLLEEKTLNLLVENPSPRGLENWEQQAVSGFSLSACSSPPI